MKTAVRSKHHILRQMVFNAIFAALICVLAPMSVPIGTVPISLGLFAVLLAGVVLDPRDSVQSVALYLVLGAVGVPVFSGWHGGFQVLVGPTGGYLWSYILVAPLVGLLRMAFPKASQHKVWGYVWEIAACIISVAVCYIGGTIQFCAVMGMAVVPALSACVFPFIPFDLFKCVAAVAIGRSVRLVKDHFASR